MVQDTKEEQTKKKLQIKAQTGAWWKSTTVETEGEGQSKSRQEKSSKAQAPKSRGRRGKATPRAKTSSRAKAETTEQAAADEAPQPAESATAATGENPPGAAEGESSPPEKKGRQKRPARKSSAKKDSGKKPPAAAQQKVDDTGKEEQDTTEDKVAGQPDNKAQTVSRLLINAEEPEECRVALLENGRLESIQVSTSSKEQRKNNIYKARIVAIEPSLQAAFVDYGTDKNGFLPFSEIHPEYYSQELSNEVRHLVETHQWKKLSINDVLRKGQELLAQVVKEEVGKKGANMTTYLSIPGRCVVLMPGSDSAGISRKISGEERRAKLREVMKSFDIPEGIGWIVRTASVDITETALSRDVDYLLKLWMEIKGRGQSLDGVGIVYEDQHSVLRFLREHFDPTLSEILVDDKVALEDVKAFVSMLPDAQQGVKVRLHQGARPIFNQYSIEDQIESIYQPQVNLPSGGSIVIDPTEALVAIDVNSGSTSKGRNFEASIFQANLEAASELARQLRLRDLGGLIVVDFIDMRSRKNILAVEKQVKEAMKRDKAKTDFSRISKFGLMQISRQKLGAPIESGNYHRCEHCKGRGTVRSVETLSLFYLRRIQTGASRKPVEKAECHFPMEVASYLLNQKRAELADMEKRYQVEIIINARSDMKPADNEIIFHKAEKEARPKKQT
jgi:ribonuclease E